MPPHSPHRAMPESMNRATTPDSGLPASWPRSVLMKCSRVFAFLRWTASQSWSSMMRSAGAGARIHSLSGTGSRLPLPSSSTFRTLP